MPSKELNRYKVLLFFTMKMSENYLGFMKVTSKDGRVMTGVAWDL